MKVLVVIPAYNEEENILKTCNELIKLKVKGHTIDYVVINDASKDNTKQVCINNQLNLIKEIENGGDLVIGSRYISELNEFKSTAMRRFGSNILRWLIKICTKTIVTDPTSGFRACNKKVIKIFANDYPIDYPEPETVASIAKRGYQVKEIPVEMNERTGGTSSINALKSVYYMIKVGLAIVFVSLFTKGDDK